MEKVIDKQKRAESQIALAWAHHGVTLDGGSMRSPRFDFRPIGAAFLTAALLTACGGGGGGDSTAGTTQPVTTQPETTTPSGGTPPSTGTTTPTTAALPAAVPGTTVMTMSCVDGPGFQCSGGSIVRTENDVALTSSGVQVAGKSTSDLATPIVVKTSASGFMLDSGSLAEIRLAKDVNGAVTTPAVLLSNLGLSWDGKTERPQIVETFRTAQGRVQLTTSGALTFGALPDPSNIAFYDFATKGTGGTQVNYANNAYFPRSGNPSRCPPDVNPCPTVESSGMQNTQGDWRTGGGVPDWMSVARLHEDGDIHAGNGVPGPGGTVTILPGGTGVGVPFPGSKGYRHMSNWGLQYANLASWASQDTVLIEEWSNLGNEHNKNRRGLVAFGAVTDPSTMPTTGTATYSGIAYGWYGRGALEEPPVFRGAATVTVNFATRQVTVTVQNTATYDAAATAVPATFTATTGMGAAGSNVANYLTGKITNGTWSGGVSGRYFGPVVATGTSGTGPAEIGGAFRMAGTGGAAIVGGFIARKQ